MTVDGVLLKWLEIIQQLLGSITADKFVCSADELQADIWRRVALLIDKESQMKILVKIILAVALVAPLWIHADIPPSTSTPNEPQLVERGSYINNDGVRVHARVHTKTGEQPTNASAQCRDGSYGFSKHHQGTRSYHSGLSRGLTKRGIFGK
jgi:hypothetical protein